MAQRILCVGAAGGVVSASIGLPALTVPTKLINSSLASDCDISRTGIAAVVLLCATCSLPSGVATPPTDILPALLMRAASATAAPPVASTSAVGTTPDDTVPSTRDWM